MWAYLLREQLELFVISVAVAVGVFNLAIFSRSGPESKVNALIGWVVGTIGWHITSILFGVKILDQMTETLLFSFLMSSMTCVAACGHVGLNSQNLKRLFVMFTVVDSKEKWILGSAIGSVLGAWFGAWPIPLDWDRWWQTWPITCVVGSMLGYSASLALLALHGVFQKSDSDKYRKD